jgi:hypothetical protein
MTRLSIRQQQATRRELIVAVAVGGTVLAHTHPAPEASDLGGRW